MQVYDSKALDTFEILASYIVDTFYNHLFLVSRDNVKLGNTQMTSLTDAYKNSVINYLIGIRNDEYYVQMVKQLHTYYQRITVFSAIGFGDFQNRILSNFIPSEYFADYSERMKDATLATILRRTIQEFGEYVLDPKVLRLTIDDHKNRQNVVMMQDTIVEALKVQREEYYVQFAKKINQRSEKVPEQLVKNLKKELAREMRKRCDLQKEREKMLDWVRQLVEKIAILEKGTAELNEKIMRLQSQIETPPTIKNVPRISAPTIDVQTQKSITNDANTNMQKLFASGAPKSIASDAQINTNAQKLPATDTQLGANTQKSIADGDKDLDVVDDLRDESTDESSSESEGDYESQRRARSEKIAEKRAVLEKPSVENSLFDDPGFGLG